MPGSAADWSSIRKVHFVTRPTGEGTGRQALYPEARTGGARPSGSREFTGATSVPGLMSSCEQDKRPTVIKAVYHTSIRSVVLELRRDCDSGCGELARSELTGLAGVFRGIFIFYLLSVNH